MPNLLSYFKCQLSFLFYFYEVSTIIISIPFNSAIILKENLRFNIINK